MARIKKDMFGYGADLGFNMWYVDSPTPRKRVAKLFKRRRK